MYLIDTNRRRTAPGAAPGTLSVAPGAVHPQIRVFTYSAEEFTEFSSALPRDLSAAPTKATRWINVDGLGDIATLQEIGSVFGLHPLALEDIVNLHYHILVFSHRLGWLRTHVCVHVHNRLSAPLAASVRLGEHRVLGRQKSRARTGLIFTDMVFVRCHRGMDRFARTARLKFQTFVIQELAGDLVSLSASTRILHLVRHWIAIDKGGNCTLASSRS